MASLNDMLGASFPDAVLVLDRRGVVLDASPGADVALLPGAVSGRPLSELWPAAPAQCVAREMRKVLKSRRPQTAWVRLSDVNGTERDWELRLRVHGRERVLVVAREAASLVPPDTATSVPDPLAAGRDPETGLRSRRWLRQQAADAFNAARLREEAVAVAVIEFPQLDTIRASFGRETGVRILQVAADRIAARVRQRRERADRDGIALLTRDAIGLLIPAADVGSGLRPVAERVVEALQAPFAVDGREYALRSGLGIAMFPRDGDDFEALLQNAYAALAEQVPGSRARPAFFSDSMLSRNLAQLDVQEELRMAIETRQLDMRFSPVARPADGRIIALEVRPVLDSPLRGEIGTARLMNFAQATGLSGLLLAQTLEQALATVPSLLGAHQALQDAAIRLSVECGQLDDHLPGEVERRCLERGVAPGQLCLTAPETAAMRADTAGPLVRLAEMGVQIMLRDFGAERLRLTDLASHRFRGVQLADELVQQLRSHAGRRLCRAVAGFVHALDMRLGAGAVDDSAQVALLLEYGCDEFAGPLLCEDLTRDALADLLAMQQRQVSA